jgi:hypothetical protein
MILEWIKTTGPIIVGLGAIIASYFLNKKMLRDQLRLKKNEDRISLINKKLTEFYGPFQHYRKTTTLIYERFRSGKGENFKTLRALLSGGKFTGNDKVLLDEILKLNKTIEDLIISKAGLIEDTKLRNEVLPKLSSHIILIRLICKDEIKGELHRFEDDVFSQEIDIEIERRINELQSELKEIKL